MTAITRNTLYRKKLFRWQIFMLFLNLYLQQIQEAYLVLSPWTCKEHIFEKNYHYQHLKTPVLRISIFTSFGSTRWIQGLLLSLSIFASMIFLQKTPPVFSMTDNTKVLQNTEDNTEPDPNGKDLLKVCWWKILLEFTPINKLDVYSTSSL